MRPRSSSLPRTRHFLPRRSRQQHQGETSSGAEAKGSERSKPRRVPTATKQAERQCVGSSHRLLYPLLLPLLSRHHSTALPSLKSYEGRYEEEGPKGSALPAPATARVWRWRATTLP